MIFPKKNAVYKFIYVKWITLFTARIFKNIIKHHLIILKLILNEHSITNSCKEKYREIIDINVDNKYFLVS